MPSALPPIEDRSSRKIAMPLPLLALCLAAFSIGTSEFVIAGILPALASDIGITIPSAALLVSLYALGVAIGGPLLATFTGRYAKKHLLLTFVGIFTIGYVGCALAPNYGVLLGMRLAISMIHGAYFGAAMVVATTLVEEKRRGFAVGLILAGLTVANIVGVPLGTAIGTHFGWRATFWTVAAMGAISFAAIAVLLPFERAQAAGARTSFLAEVKALGREPVYSSLAIIILQTVGQFAFFTFISPFLTGISGVSIDTVPWLLLLSGVGSTIGVLLGGRLADWNLMGSLTGILVLEVLAYLLILVFETSPIAMGVLMLVWGAVVFGFSASVQTRILNNTRDAPTLAANLIPSAFNIAIAIGAGLGGAMIDGGVSYGVLPWVGVVGAVLSVGVALASWRVLHQRLRATVPLA
jgi:DHA1 family inner membrane transport protein